MDTVKAILKSKSSHELLSTAMPPLPPPTGAVSTQSLDPPQPPSLNGCTQLLQVPGSGAAGSSCSSSKLSSSVSESSELSQLSDLDQSGFVSGEGKESSRKLKKLQKSIRKQRKRNEKQLTELIQFLHLGQSPAAGVGQDEEDLPLGGAQAGGKDAALLNRSNEETDGRPAKRKIGMSKSLNLDSRVSPDGQETANGRSSRKPSAAENSASNGLAGLSGLTGAAALLPPALLLQLQMINGGDRSELDGNDEADYAEENERTITNNDTITANGFRRIRRFGYDVADGCGFPLSLRREADPEADGVSTLKRHKSWTEILGEASDYLRKQSVGTAKIAINQLYEVCPCPEVEFASMAGRLPFRRWNSELRMSSVRLRDREPFGCGSFGVAAAVAAAAGVTGSVAGWIGGLSSGLGLGQAMQQRHSCEDLRHLSSGSFGGSGDREFRMLRRPEATSESGCFSGEFSSEHSTCSLRSISSSGSSISGVSTLVGLDLTQLGRFGFQFTGKTFFFDCLLLDKSSNPEYCANVLRLAELNPYEVFMHYFEPRLVAVELTKIEIELFLQLNGTELSREIFAPNRNLNLSQFFEIHCIYFFVQLVLAEQQLLARVQCLRLCIEVSSAFNQEAQFADFNLN